MKKTLAARKLSELTEDQITPSRILSIVTDEPCEFDDWSFVILGRPGPTGKTWLYQRMFDLRAFDVTEISESLCSFVTYNDSKNHIIIDNVTDTIIVILNRPLPMLKKVHVTINAEPCPYWDYSEHKARHSCQSCTSDRIGNNIDNADYGVMINGDKYCTIGANVKADIVDAIDSL